MVWCFKRIEIFYTFGISKSSLIYSHFKEYLLHVNPIKPAIQWCLETKKSVLEDLEKMIQIASSFKIPLFFGKENKTILFGIFILMTIFMMCFTSVVLLWVSKNFLFLKRKEIVSK